MKKLTPEVAETLKSYVYVYVDPRDDKPFYVGKGKGSRLFTHLEDTDDSEKAALIQEIRKSGREPRIDLLRYGLTDAQALLVEAAAIDLIGKDKLTNRVAGYHENSFGRISSEEVITMLTAKSVEVTHKAVLITINKRYRSYMSDRELYEATRGIWVIGPRREETEYAMAVYQGIVRQVYRIIEWHPAGTLEYQTRDISPYRSGGRWEFEGEVVDDEIREQYVGFSVGKGGQNPIKYQNV
jgi:hypothetical protein